MRWFTRLYKRIALWFRRRQNWRKTYRMLHQAAKGKPLFQEDGYTPDADQAALYKHCNGGTMDGYPPPLEQNERLDHWPTLKH